MEQGYKSLHSGPNPKYFGSDCDVTSYNYMSNQFTRLHGLVIPGTITAGYIDIIFGIFRLLGYQFIPRLANISKSRLWRFDVNSDYEISNNSSKSHIREELLTSSLGRHASCCGTFEMQHTFSPSVTV